MPLIKHRFVGSSVDYYIPDDIKVEIKIIDHPRFRSYQRHNDHYLTTWHDTGNPNTNADAEYRWAAGGRQGGSVGGYNFIFDDNKIIQASPLNETTWAAGTPTGNRVSWHAEQAWGAGVDFDRSLYVGAALHGALCAAQGWDVTKALVQHNYWYGKHCPGQIRNRGLWPRIVNMTATAADLARAAATGKVITDPAKETIKDAGGWLYPKPVKPAFWDALLADDATHVLDSGTLWYRVSNLYRVRQVTKRQQYAIKDDRVVGPDLDVGATFRAEAVGQSVSDKRSYVITPGLTRVELAALDYVEDQEPDVSALKASLKSAL